MVFEVDGSVNRLARRQHGAGRLDEQLGDDDGLVDRLRAALDDVRLVVARGRHHLGRARHRGEELDRRQRHAVAGGGAGRVQRARLEQRQQVALRHLPAGGVVEVDDPLGTLGAGDRAGTGLPVRAAIGGDAHGPFLLCLGRLCGGDGQLVEADADIAALLGHEDRLGERDGLAGGLR